MALTFATLERQGCSTRYPFLWNLPSFSTHPYPQREVKSQYADKGFKARLNIPLH